jgi:FlaA1/EpsC-like NDP-sugar epimerase
MSYFDGKDILITGGTGTVGTVLVETILAKSAPNRLIVFSRDEHKQFFMAKKFPNNNNNDSPLSKQKRWDQSYKQKQKDIKMLSRIQEAGTIAMAFDEYNMLSLVEANTYKFKTKVQVLIKLHGWKSNKTLWW